MGGTRGVSTSKRALFDPAAPGRLIGAADPVIEAAPIYLMVRLGLHPKNIRTFTAKNIEKDAQGYWLQFRRAKNAMPRRELLGDDIGRKVTEYVDRRSRPKTTQAFWLMSRRVAEKARFEDWRSITPMTLRHTACIGFLREYSGHPERITLVAMRMGCTPRVVQQNYIDLDQWEKTR